jgi:hypothetical protein
MTTGSHPAPEEAAAGVIAWSARRCPPGRPAAGRDPLATVNAAVTTVDVAVVAAAARAIAEPVADRLAAASAVPITVAGPVAEPFGDGLTNATTTPISGLTTTTVARTAVELVGERPARPSVVVRVDDPAVAPPGVPAVAREEHRVVDDLSGLLVDVARAGRAPRRRAARRGSRCPRWEQQAVGVVEVVERGVDQLALVVGQIHRPWARSW